MGAMTQFDTLSGAARAGKAVADDLARALSPDVRSWRQRTIGSVVDWVLIAKDPGYFVVYEYWINHRHELGWGWMHEHTRECAQPCSAPRGHRGFDSKEAAMAHCDKTAAVSTW